MSVMRVAHWNAYMQIRFVYVFYIFGVSARIGVVNERCCWSSVMCWSVVQSKHRLWLWAWRTCELFANRTGGNPARSAIQFTGLVFCVASKKWEFMKCFANKYHARTRSYIPKLFLWLVTHENEWHNHPLCTAVIIWIIYTLKQLRSKPRGYQLLHSVLLECMWSITTRTCFVHARLGRPPNGGDHLKMRTSRGVIQHEWVTDIGQLDTHTIFVLGAHWVC